MQGILKKIGYILLIAYTLYIASKLVGDLKITMFWADKVDRLTVMRAPQFEGNMLTITIRNPYETEMHLSRIEVYKGNQKIGEWNSETYIPPRKSVVARVSLNTEVRKGDLIKVSAKIDGTAIESYYRVGE